ncbi:MAG: HTH domain-containing protein [Gammaproteobacteria bacterium]|nr:HTH domain-containing protein [Gammaproteobacteria bacterium]
MDRDVKKAAIQVLQQARKALHAREITQRIMAAGLWRTKGKTPDATVSARLYSDIKSNGDKSPFVKVGPQTFALRESAEIPRSSGPVYVSVERAPKPSAANAGFSFTDCAQKVLEVFGGKKPMHYKEITEKALRKGWLVTGGKTPEATMYAQVITEIKRQQKRGERPRFVQHGRGYVGLSQWMGLGLAFQIEQHNQQVRKALRERLLAMKPGEFEELISQLLAEMGFEMVEVTKLSGDGGIDVRGTLVVGDVVRIKMAVQVKKWKLKNNIQAPVVQQVRGSLGAHEQGLIITTSDFSPGAVKEAAQADKTPIALMNGEQLVMLLMGHGIGVHRSTPDLFEIDEDGESGLCKPSGLRKGG